MNNFQYNEEKFIIKTDKLYLINFLSTYISFSTFKLYKNLTLYIYIYMSEQKFKFNAFEINKIVRLQKIPNRY